MEMLHIRYDYSGPKRYCEELGLIWFGDDYMADIDKAAHAMNFTQEQFNFAIWNHLWQVKHLFTPSTYSFKQRILLALHFLLDREIKPKK